MNSLTKYLVESILQEEIDNVTVLLPGGFKPPHAGHLHLAKTYAELPNVKEVLVMVGPSPRDGFTRETSLAIWKKLIAASGLNNIKVVPTTADNPLTAAYQYIQIAKPGNYALAASTKGDDFIRVKRFTDQHQSGGKYVTTLPKGVQVTLLPIDPKPLNYKNRTDGNKGGISASALRKDIQAGNKQNILSNYPNIPQQVQTQILGLLLGRLMESIMTPADVLSEGGAAGHLAHPYEDLDLTFQDLHDMIDASLSGNLSFVQEKLDGQNLMITFKDGQVRAARNKTQLKNYGQASLTIKDIKKMFADRGPIQVAFTEAMRDLETAIQKLSPQQKQEFFENGRRFLSLEVLYPDTANVIPYGASQLRLHHFKIYDENGNIVDEDTDGIKALQVALDTQQAAQQKTFQVRTTDLAQLKQDTDYKTQKTYFDEKVNKIQKQYSLGKQDTIGTYNDNWWEQYITKAAKNQKYNISDEVLQLLVARWARSDKSVSIKEVLRQIDSQEFAQWVVNFDKTDLADQKKVALKPVEELFLQLGVRVLKNIENLVSTNPDESIRKIKADLQKSIENIKSAAASGRIADKDKAIKFLKAQLERLQNLGGFDAIVPTEGIVFKYNGKLYKLTGAFAPINQLIGYLRF
jgi:hypothetical protein